jgi:antitoxin component YwqK of YwqJK toxin-antitoxin module
MNQFNERGEKHGPWEQYHDNGNLWYKGEYVNDEYHGPWQFYYSHGSLNGLIQFSYGNQVGYYIHYRISGELNDKEFYL